MRVFATHAIPFALAFMLGSPAMADALSDAKAAAQAFERTQPQSRWGGYFGSPTSTPGGLSPAPNPPTYDYMIVGSGMDALHGIPTDTCFDPTSIHLGSKGIWRGETDFTLAKYDSDIENYLESKASTDGGISLGSFGAKTTLNIDFNSQITMTINRSAIVARYDYTRGSRYLVAPLPKLAPVYQAMVDSKRFSDFWQNCGSTFLRTVDEGASLVVIYTMEKQTESHATDDEIKGSFGARFGLASGSASVAYTQRDKAIVDSYTVTSHCFVLGGDPSSCRFVQEESDINAAWGALAQSMIMHPEMVAAIRADFEPYTDVLPKQAALASFRPYLDAMNAWTDVESQLRFLCDSATYMDCTAAFADVAANIVACQNQTSACNASPSIGLYGQYYDADLGDTVFADQPKSTHANTQYLHFMFRPDPESIALVPGVLYRLDEIGWQNRIRFLQINPNAAPYWALELYEYPDGTGNKISTASCFQGYWCDTLPDAIDMKAQSFRMVRRTIQQ